MKTTNLRLGAFLMSILLFFATSCNIYQRSTANIGEAVNSNNNVKIITVDGRKAFYKRLEKQDGVLFGVVGNNTVELNEKRIKEVYLKDRSKSTLATIAIPVVIVGVAIGVFANSVNNVDIEL